jgi:hypothetical protein
MFFEILNISLAVVFILIIWFKTNAFCEYLEYFHFQNHFFINDYYKFRSKSTCPLHYTDFLLLKNNSFFIRLISCPICLGVWFNVIFSTAFGFQDFFIKFYLSSFLYYLYCIIIKYSHD